MIKFIIKLLKFAICLFIIFIIFTYFFAQKNGHSFEDTLSYFKLIANEFIGFEKKENEIIGVNSNVSSSTEIDYYYYNQLDETSKIIYTALENNIDNLKKEKYVIDFSTRFNDLLNESIGQYKLNKSFQSALDAFFYDHPEIFYIDLTKISLNIKCVSLGPLKTYTVEIVPKNNKNYLVDSFVSETEVNIAINAIENARNNIINNLSNEDTYQKIKEVHDILVNSITYDTSTSRRNAHNIYGALIEKEVVCEGYARSFKYIMDSLNIECILVAGNSTDFSNKLVSHMWNYIKLDNNWYGVDVTWDDPIIIGDTTLNNLRHNYLLKGNNSFMDSHIPSGRISETGMLFSIPDLADINYRW